MKNTYDPAKSYQATCNLIADEKNTIKVIESLIAKRLLIGDTSSDIYLFLKSQLDTAKNNLDMLFDVKESI